MMQSDRVRRVESAESVTGTQSELECCALLLQRVVSELLRATSRLRIAIEIG